MENDEEYKKIYKKLIENEQIKKHIKDHNKKIMKINTDTSYDTIILLCIAGIISIIFIYFNYNNIERMIYFFGIMLGTIAIINVKFNDRLIGGKKEFTQIIINYLVKDIFNGAEFYYNAGIKKEDDDKFYREKSCKYVSNKIVKFKNNEFANVCTYIENGEDTYTQFYGIEGKIKIINKEEIAIRILKNRIKELFKNEEIKKIQLDVELFENQYDIYSKNDVMAYKLITPNLALELININKKYHIKLEIVIENDMLYYRFPTYTKQNFLDITLNKEEIYKQYLEYINIRNILNDIKRIFKDIEIEK